MNDIISPLNEDERARESYLRQRISDGLSISSKAYDILIPCFIEIFNKRLYREEGDMEMWAQKNFGLTSRTLYYYLEMGGVKQDILSVIPEANLDDMAMRHAIALGQYTPESRPIIWQAAQDSGETVTEKAIKKIAGELEREGSVKRRDGILEDEERARSRAIRVILKEWKGLDNTGIVQMLTAIIESSDDLQIQLMLSVIQSYAHETSGANT